MIKNSIFFSIDFEDSSHDLKRDLGIWKTGLLREEALWKSYEQINNFLKSYNNVKITFFCTGIIAKQIPDLIKKISEDGHEIGCHYFYHDEMNKQNSQEIEKNIILAKEKLEIASGNFVSGFRAPKFKILKDNPTQYKILAKHFKYDSSWYGSNIETLKFFLKKMNLLDFTIFPIFSDKLISFLPNFKIGGSYLKLFPKNITSQLIYKSVKNKIVPHIYVHNYEMTNNREFFLNFNELDIKLLKKFYWYFRQNQWYTVGNSSLHNKLNHIIGSKKVLGKLSENLNYGFRIN